MVALRLLDRRAELTEAILVASDVEARRVLLPGVAGPLEQTDRFATVRDRFGEIRPAVERQPGETQRLRLAPDVAERPAQLERFRGVAPEPATQADHHSDIGVQNAGLRELGGARVPSG